MLLDKYKPLSLEEIVGSKMEISKIRHWISNWKQGTGLIIYGVHGCGKNLIIETLAKTFGYELLEISGLDLNKEFSESLLRASKQKSIFFAGKIILIDNAELVKYAKHLTAIIRESKFPVIMITDEPYSKKFYSLRRTCSIIKLRKIRYTEIKKFLEKICKYESILFNEKTLTHLSKSCNSDIRALLIDLETLKNDMNASCLPDWRFRNQIENIFNILKILFNTNSIENAKIAYDQCDLSPSDISKWIQENITAVYHNEELVSAYKYLSEADVFNSRIIKTQSWTLLKYVIELIIYGTALSGRSIKQYTRYQPPRYRKTILNTAEPIIEKIAETLHLSKKRTAKELDVLKKIIMQQKTADELGFDEDDLEIISGL